MLRSLFVLLLVLGASTGEADATPPWGAVLPTVTFSDLDGRPRTLPERGAAVIVIYEDSKAGQQNTRACDLIDRTTDIPSNKGKIEAVAIADLAKWNWWPAKKFAIAEMKKIAAQEGAMIYTDWKGEVRKAWGLTKGKSGILVLGTDGRVRFAGEGPLAESELLQLTGTMVQLGVSVPPPKGAALVKHAAPEAEHKVPEGK